MRKSNSHLQVIFSTLAVSVLLLLGICLFIHCSARYYFSSEIDGVGIFSLAVTIALAVIISIVLAKKDEAERNDKNFIIEDIKGVKSDIHLATIGLLSETVLKLAETVSGLSVLRNGVRASIELAKEYNFVDKDSVSAKELAEAFSDFERLFTDSGEVAAANGSRVTIDNGNITLDAGRKDAVRKVLTRIDGLILKISIEINRH